MARAAQSEFEMLLGEEELQTDDSRDTFAADLGAQSEGGAGAAAAPRSRRRTAAATALAATCLLVAAAVVWSLQSPKPTASSGDDVQSLVGVTATNIRWLAHPEKCLDVAGTECGAGLQIWDCDPSYPKQQGFMVPADGTTGRIRWAQNPELCLDSPGGHAVQFWWCNKAPAENLLWTVSPDGKGRIHWAAHPEQCLDIPDAHTENGWKLQVWYCKDTERAGKDSNLRFVSHPVDCEWSEWGEWGPCSRSCGVGTHSRTRAVARPAMNGGQDCGADSDDAARCNTASCPGESAERTAARSQETTAAPTAAGVGQLMPVKDVHPVERRKNGAARLPVPLWLLPLTLGAAAATAA